MKENLPFLCRPMTLCSTVILCLCFPGFLKAQNAGQILYTQNTPAYGHVISYQDFELGGEAFYQSADDFEVPAGQTWNLTKVTVPGTTVPSTTSMYQYLGEIVIFSDDDGKPGEEILKSGIINSSSGLGNADLELILPDTITLDAGIYWLSILGRIDEYYPAERWHWRTTAVVKRHPAYFRNTGDPYYTQGDWVPLYKFDPQPPVDLLFTLYGSATGIAAPVSPYSLTVTYNDPVFDLAWRDDAADETGFVIERSTDGEMFTSIATVGQDDTTYADNDTFDHTLRYHYRVAALDSAGISSYSNVAFDDVADTLYVQAATPEGGQSNSQKYPDTGVVYSADDFVIPDDQTWKIKEVYVVGNSGPGIEHIKNAFVKIFADSAGYPSKNELYASGPVTIPYDDRTNPSMNFSVPEVITLSTGRYWVSVYTELYEEEAYWDWNGTSMVTGTETHMWDKDNIIGLATRGWFPSHDYFGYDPFDLVFTLSGVSDTDTTDSSALEAPVAKLATFVTPTSFTANWQPVQGADHYTLDVFDVRDSLSLPGYEGKIVYDTSQPVTGTLPYKRYKYVVRAINAEDTSGYSNTIRVASIKDLTLRSVCSDTPTVYRRWKVISNNPFPVEVTWNVLNTTQTGTHMATTGESFFTTETIPGLNKTSITWYDDEEQEHMSVKSSTWKPCSADKVNALARNGYDDEGGKDIRSLFMVEAYSNPVKDKLGIVIASPLEGEADIEIISLNGQRLYTGTVLTNTEEEIDAHAFSSGILILRVRQGIYSHVLKLVKP